MLTRCEIVPSCLADAHRDTTLHPGQNMLLCGLLRLCRLYHWQDCKQPGVFMQKGYCVYGMQCEHEAKAAAKAQCSPYSLGHMGVQSAALIEQQLQQL